MYFYLYDAFTRDKKYERTLARIESRVFQLGMQGKSEKMTILKSMHDVLRTALQRDATTVVVIGNDATLNRAVNFLFGKEVLLGFIPLGDERIGHLLSIPHGEAACDTLSRRIITHLDVGKANTTHFLTHVALGPTNDCVLVSDGRMTVTATGPHLLTVSSVGWKTSDPTDGILETVLEPQNQRRVTRTVFSARTLRIASPTSVNAYADGVVVVKTPIDISVQRKAIRMIVGKASFLS